MYKHKQLVFVLADILAILLSFGASIFILFGSAEWQSFFVERAWLLLWIGIVSLSILYLMDVYFFRRDFTKINDQLTLLLALGLILVAETTIIFLSGAKDFIGRGFLLYDTLLKGALICLFKIGLSLVFKKINFTRRALIIGTGKKVRWGIDFIKRNRDLGIELIRVLSEERSGEQAEIEGIEITYDHEGLLKTIDELGINLIILASDRDQITTLQESLILCHQKQIPLIAAEKLYENISNKVPYENIDSLQLFNACLWQGKFKVFRSKRLVDVAISGLLLLATLPIMAVVALLVKIFSPGPILFRQIRLGINGRPFNLMKFRTMTVDAEKDGELTLTQKNDVRITKIGKFLRVTHLDELPQFINVLKGDMSMVGPRPERPEFIEKLEKIIPFYSLRLSVPPGITGWAQVKYKYASSIQGMKEKFKYDLYYIKNLSFLMDIKVILQTIFHVLFVKGQ